MKHVAATIWMCFATLLGAEPPVATPPAPTACPLCAQESVVLTGITETIWQEPVARSKAWTGNYSVSDQDGKPLKLDDLVGKPLAVTFLYTRCTNPNKCPLAATTVAQLQKALRAAGLETNVRVLIVTYDPDYDSPAVLKRYAAEKGLECNDNLCFLRPDPADRSRLFGDLNVSVNYNGMGVNIHGLQMILIDKAGRTAHTYRTLIWDNAKVLADLKKLATE
jgi:protein SCO1/2